MVTNQIHFPTFNTQHRSFAQTNHINVRINFQELFDALFACFAAMSFRIGIQVMRIDLKRHQINGIKTLRVDDRHVVGGSQSRASNV